MAESPDTTSHATDRPGSAGGILRRAGAATAVALVSAGIAAASGRFVVYPLADAASATFLLREKPRLAPADYWRLVDGVPSLIAVAVVLLSALTFLVVAGAARRVPRGPGTPGRWRRVVRAAPLVVWTIGLLGLAVPAGIEATTRLTAPGRRDFVDHCGRCHAVRRPLDFIQPRAGWENTVRRMAAKPGAEIDGPAAERIVAYLAATRTVSIPDLVRGRCGRCHEAPAAASVAATPLRVRRMIDRLSALDSRLWEPDDADAIAAYLASGKDVPPPYPAEIQDRFERVCETCHFLDVVRQPLLHGNWPEVLRRMSSKAPALLSAMAARELEPVVRAEAADPAGFRTRYPHSGLPDPGTRAR